MTEHHSLPDIGIGRSLLFVIVVSWVGCRFGNPAFEDGESLDTSGMTKLADSGSETQTAIPSIGDSGGIGDSASEATANTAASLETSTDSNTGGTGSDGTSSESSEGSEGDESTESGEDPLGLCSDFVEDLIACCVFQKIPTSDKITDKSGHGNHLEVRNAMLSPMGHTGQALVGKEERRASVPDVAIFDVAGFTISLSVFHYSIPDDSQVGFFDNDLQYTALVENNRLLCNDGNRSIDGPMPSANQWSTIVCTSDQSTMRLYTNGMLIKEMSIDSAREPNNNPITIANMRPGFDRPFLGLLDNLRIWGRGFTPMEVAELDN